MKNVFRSLVYIGLLGSLFSCDLVETIDDLGETDKSIDALKEYIVVSKQYQDVSNTVDASVLNAQSLIEDNLKATNASAIITVEPFNTYEWPKTITVDFGDGVKGGDGIERSGKLIIVSDQWYRVEGSVHTTTFENYYQDGYHVEGTRTATNLGNADGEGLQFSVAIADGMVSKDGAQITYRQNTTRTWTEGSDTPVNLSDDVYLIEGTQNGVSSEGINYELNVVDPLKFVVLSRRFTEGIMDVDMEGMPDIVLNYSTSSIKIGGHLFPMN